MRPEKEAELRAMLEKMGRRADRITAGLEKLADSAAFERIIADAEQRGREDNAYHGMCYVSGSRALEARLASAWDEGAAKAREYRDDLDLSPLNPYREASE